MGTESLNTKRNLVSRAINLFFGKAYYAPANSKPGVPMSPVYWHNFGAIAAASSNAVATSQSVAAAGSFSLNGALVSSGIATFPTPRNIVLAWTNTAVVTITGKDEYGQTVVEVSASGTSHTGKKAFKSITSITSSASITGATAGTGTVIGLPHRVDENGLIIAKVDGATDAATFVEAVTTTGTGTSGDVRGTVAFSSAPDGTKVFAVLYKIASAESKEGAYGVSQYAG